MTGTSISDTSGDDLPEAIELERAAEWRMRLVDANPSDESSLRAARQFEKLAHEVRALRGAPIYTEYMAICNWLGESDDISEFRMRAEYFRERLGFGTWADTGESYMRILIELARESAGMA
ncbi:MAG: hypothetical protein AB7O80_13205 [Acetobacteraceae bacterium]